MGYSFWRRYLASLFGIPLLPHPSATHSYSSTTGPPAVSELHAAQVEGRYGESPSSGFAGRSKQVRDPHVVDVEDPRYQEAQLLTLVAAADVEGPVGELYRRYGRRLYRFGVQALGNDALAEEMVQETFVRLRRTAGQYDAQRASVDTYLFAIARSVALDIRERSSSRDLLPLNELDSVEQVLDSLILREALDTLSVAHRQVLRLAYDQGLTQSQIAERLGLPLGTVKTRMFHATQALRSALDERGFHLDPGTTTPAPDNQPPPDLQDRTIARVARDRA